MCIHSDLFGDVIVTFDDVEFWLDNVPRSLSASPTRRLNYAIDYNVSSKIAAAKLSGEFYRMQVEVERSFSRAPSLIPFMHLGRVLGGKTFTDVAFGGAALPPPVCAGHFCFCGLETCAVFKAKALRKKRSDAYYNKKAAKLKADRAAKTLVHGQHGVTDSEPSEALPIILQAA